MKTLVAVLSLLALPLTPLADERDDAPLDELLAGLSSKDPRTRARAAQGCGQLGPAGAACIPGLLELLDDDHGFEWGPEDGVEHAGIGSTPGSEAAYALATIGEAAVEGLIRTARGRNAHGRVGTVFALGEIGDPRGLELMIAALRDRNAEVRAEAAASLSLEPRTLQPYIRALEDRNVDVRLEAARALVGDWAVSETVEPLAKVALRDRDVDVACTAMYSLALGGDPRGAMPSPPCCGNRIEIRPYERAPRVTSTRFGGTPWPSMPCSRQPATPRRASRSPPSVLSADCETSARPIFC